ILQFSKLYLVKSRTANEVPIELADGRRQRPQGRSHSIRKSRITQFFEHDLAREIAVCSVCKSQLYYGQAEYRARAARDHVGDAVERPLDRHRDLLFHFFGGMSWVESDDDRLCVGNVGVRLDFELPE